MFWINLFERVLFKENLTQTTAQDAEITKNTL